MNSTKPEQKRLPEDKAAEIRMWIERLEREPKATTHTRDYQRWALTNSEMLLSGEYDEHVAEIRTEVRKELGK